MKIWSTTRVLAVHALHRMMHTHWVGLFCNWHSLLQNLFHITLVLQVVTLFTNLRRDSPKCPECYDSHQGDLVPQYLVELTKLACMGDNLITKTMHKTMHKTTHSASSCKWWTLPGSPLFFTVCNQKVEEEPGNEAKLDSDVICVMWSIHKA